MPDNEGDFRYCCSNLLIKPSKADEFWKIHSGTNKEMRFKIASVHFRPIE
jgi:hypothetical protein